MNFTEEQKNSSVNDITPKYPPIFNTFIQNVLLWAKNLGFFAPFEPLKPFNLAQKRLTLKIHINA